MKEIIKMGLTLLLICVIAAATLGVVNEITKGPIEQNRLETAKKNRQTVFPDATDFKLLYSKDPAATYEENDKTEKVAELGKIFEVYSAVDDSENVLGYVFKSLPNGYGGPLEVIVGVSLDGKLTGVRVGKHSETPGLGAKSQGEDFFSQYDNKDVMKQIGVTKLTPKETEIKAISGATITSAAVTRGVNLGKNIIEIMKGE